MPDGQTNRRAFIVGLGGAVAWPVVARAQQPMMPVIGFLSDQSPDFFADGMRGFHQGLKDTGYVEGENVAVEYRWAENQFDRLPALAAELVRRRVTVIVSGTSSTALAAKTATTTVPILFIAAEDPVKRGLVASLGRPGGNLTGVNFFAVELVKKRLELLRELVPKATRVAVLVSPTNAAVTEATLKDVEAAAPSMGCKSKCSTPTTVARLMQRSRRSCASDPTPFSSTPALFLPVGVFNWSSWQRATRYPRYMECANALKSAG